MFCISWVRLSLYGKKTWNPEPQRLLEREEAKVLLPEAYTMSDPSSDQALRAYLQEQGIEVADEKNLEFHYDQARVRVALKTLVAEEPQLWLFHLYQLLDSLDGIQGPTLDILPEGKAIWRLTGLSRQDSESLAIREVVQQWDNPLGSSLGSRMARVLWECRGLIKYRTGSLPKAQMSVENGSHSIEAADFPRPSENHQLLLEFSEKLLTPREFPSVAPHGVCWPSLRRVSCLHPLPTLCRGARTHPAEWPDLTPQDPESDPMRWDWESVSVCDRGSGFHWDVSPWGERFDEIPQSEGRLIFHPVEERRAHSYRPIFGNYPKSLDELWTLDPSAPRISLNVQRVLGVSWALTSDHRARIIPMIQGVPGLPIDLPCAPAGLICLAEAGHLHRDVSGRALVADGAHREWMNSIEEWMKVQVALYAPVLPRTGEFWMRRVSEPSKLQSSRGMGKQVLDPALGRVYTDKPLQTSILRRQNTLLQWSLSPTSLT